MNNPVKTRSSIWASQTPCLTLTLDRVFLILVMVSGLFLSLAGAVDGQEQGYWKYVRMDQERGDDWESGPHSTVWVGEAGKILVSRRFKDLRPSDSRELSAQIIWNGPPKILRPGQEFSLPITVQITVNSHEEKPGMGLGGFAVAWIGPSQSGGNTAFWEGDDYQLNWVTNGSKIKTRHVKKFSAGISQLDGKQKMLPPRSTDPLDKEGRPLIPIVIELSSGGGEKQTFKYIYAWHKGTPPVSPPDKVVPTEPVPETSESVDIKGVWQHGENGETWTFVPVANGRYKATESGFVNASGFATMKGNEVSFDYTTKTGKKGTYKIVIAKDG